MKFVPAGGSIAESGVPQVTTTDNQEEGPRSSAKVTVEERPASPSLIGRQEEALEGRKPDSVYAKRLEDKLPPEDRLHQLIADK